jgi:hypothetical protein
MHTLPPTAGPCCDQIVSNDEYSSHVQKCRTVNERALREKKLAAEKAKKEAAMTGGGGGGGGKAPLPISGKAGQKPVVVKEDPIPPPDPSRVPPGRSKIPQAVLDRLAAAAKGIVELTPEQKLLKRLGSPCDACGATAADTSCLGCHAVYCAPCSATLHESNAALTPEFGHSPVLQAVEAEKEGLKAVPVDHRVECGICQRKFDPMRIAKHQIVCASQDRKVIKVKYATDLRVKGTDFETFLKKVRPRSLPPPSRSPCPCSRPKDHTSPHPPPPPFVPPKHNNIFFPPPFLCPCRRGSLRAARLRKRRPPQWRPQSGASSTSRSWQWLPLKRQLLVAAASLAAVAAAAAVEGVHPLPPSPPPPLQQREAPPPPPPPPPQRP